MLNNNFDFNINLKLREHAGQWWCMSLIPTRGRQRQLGVQGQSGLQSEFQDRLRSYTEKFCLKKTNTKERERTHLSIYVHEQVYEQNLLIQLKNKQINKIKIKLRKYNLP